MARSRSTSPLTEPLTKANVQGPGWPADSRTVATRGELVKPEAVWAGARLGHPSRAFRVGSSRVQRRRTPHQGIFLPSHLPLATLSGPVTTACCCKRSCAATAVSILTAENDGNRTVRMGTSAVAGGLTCSARLSTLRQPESSSPDTSRVVRLTHAPAHVTAAGRRPDGDGEQSALRMPAGLLPSSPPPLSTTEAVVGRSPAYFVNPAIRKAQTDLWASVASAQCTSQTTVRPLRNDDRSRAILG